MRALGFEPKKVWKHFDSPSSGPPRYIAASTPALRSRLRLSHTWEPVPLVVLWAHTLVPRWACASRRRSRR